jgi:hypothetical protein
MCEDKKKNTSRYSTRGNKLETAKVLLNEAETGLAALHGMAEGKEKDVLLALAEEERSVAVAEASVAAATKMHAKAGENKSAGQKIASRPKQYAMNTTGTTEAIPKPAKPTHKKNGPGAKVLAWKVRQCYLLCVTTS